MFVGGIQVAVLAGFILGKKVDHKKHFMVKYRAWGIDAAMLEELKDRCDVIQILDERSKVFFWARYEDFVQKGVKDDFGHGVQVFLPLQHWCYQRTLWEHHTPKDHWEVRA